MNLSVVIPAYNESGNIEATLNELHGALKKIADITNAEFIIVDDHSSDDLFEAVRGMSEIKTTYLKLSKRSGSHVALRAGMDEARGDAVLAISADGQEDPSCIKDMVGKWLNGSKVVWALRRDRKNEPWYIRKPSQLFYRVLFWLGGVKNMDIDLSMADFFLLDKNVVAALKSCPERNTSLFGLIAWAGFSHDSVEYERRLRRSGKTKWSLRTRFRLAKDWIVAFSGLPLKLITAGGLFFALLGFLFGAYLVGNVMFGNPVPGWTSLMVAILVIGGVQMVMLGVTGEYIWRNLDESRRRPLYFIEQRSETNKR